MTKHIKRNAWPYELYHNEDGDLVIKQEDFFNGESIVLISKNQINVFISDVAEFKLK